MIEVKATRNAQRQGDSTALRVPVERLHAWVTRLLTCAGLPSDDASVVADNIVEAECRDVRSHGLILLPVYVERVRGGGIKSNYTIITVRDTGPTVLLDGDGGPGQVLATQAMSIALARADRFGIAYVCVRNSNHVGMLASYGLRAASAGKIGLIMTNSGPSVMAARGRGRRMGNNAICVAVPGQPEPLVLDMATGVVACGKIRLAAMHGETIPEHWMCDEQGRATQNPLDLDRGGSVVPCGDYKGYGLAAIVDVLTALLSGGTPSLEVVTQRSMPSRPTGACQAFAALDPELFCGRETLAGGVRDYAEALRQTTPLDEDLPVLAPGDFELIASHKAESEGVHISAPTVELMDKLASEVGTIPLSSSP
jgi:ureidoglycolate dehydrogenase (NAD+)